MRLGRGQRREGVVKAPERGALIWLTFTPQSGREQAGRRPALVVSPSAYNSKVGLALVCLGLPRFSGQVNRRHAMTLRLSIDDQSNQDQAPVHGAAKAGGC